MFSMQKGTCHQRPPVFEKPYFYGQYGGFLRQVLLYLQRQAKHNMTRGGVNSLLTGNQLIATT